MPEKHISNYLKYFNMGEQSWFGCELCGAQASHFHHIKFRSRYKGKDRDDVENIMLLCAKDHRDAHSSKVSPEELQEIHEFHLKHFLP